ncbi:hypothetical protein OKW45_004206 [Paraburkholderia sp. WSM4175]
MGCNVLQPQASRQDTLRRPRRHRDWVEGRGEDLHVTRTVPSNGWGLARHRRGFGAVAKAGPNRAAEGSLQRRSWFVTLRPSIRLHAGAVSVAHHSTIFRLASATGQSRETRYLRSATVGKGSERTGSRGGTDDRCASEAAVYMMRRPTAEMGRVLPIDAMRCSSCVCRSHEAATGADPPSECLRDGTDE